MKCPKCGMKLPDDSEFCQYCGTQVSIEKTERNTLNVPTDDNHATRSSQASKGSIIDFDKVLVSYKKLSAEQKSDFFPGGEAQAQKVGSSLAFLMGTTSDYDVVFEIYLTVASRVKLGFTNERIQTTLMARYPTQIPSNVTIPIIKCIRRITENYSHMEPENSNRRTSADIMFILQNGPRMRENEEKHNDAVNKPGFGTDPKNPIYAHSARTSYDYLNSLYTDESVPLTWNRIGSIAIDNCPDPIDEYELLLPDGALYTSVYINMYAETSSIYCPRGLKSSELQALPDTSESSPIEESMERAKESKLNEFDDFLAKYSKDLTGKETEHKREDKTDTQPAPPKNDYAIPQTKATVETQKTSTTKPREDENRHNPKRQVPTDSQETAKNHSEPIEILNDWSGRILQGNLPVALERTTLKQIADGTVVLYCTFRSASVESIRAVQVDVKCLDVWNEPLQSVDGYQYLDLKTKIDSSFGENAPIPIPDPRTRNVEVQIRRIALANGEVMLRKEDRISGPEPGRAEQGLKNKENQRSKSIRPISNDKKTKRFLGLPVWAWMIGVVCIAVVALASYYIVKGKLLNADQPTASAQIIQDQQTYTVLLNRAEGDGGTTTINVLEDGVLPLAYAPTKRGYSFKGYYSDRNGHGTMYYNYAMESAHGWDKESDGTMYAFWVESEEKQFSSSSLVGEPVYVDIRSIAPKYGIKDPLTGEYAVFVCECETYNGPTAWVLLRSSTYKTFYDYKVDLNGDPSLNERKTFDKRRIHGNVIAARSISSDLPDKTATKLVEFYSQD